MIRSRLSGPPLAARVPTRLVSVLVVSYGMSVVALFASGRLSFYLAGMLLAAPAVLGLAVLRPEWVILVIAGLPPAFISPIPPMQMIAIMLVTLFGFLLQGGLRLGPKTGVFPLIGIILLAIALKGSVPLEAVATADEVLSLIIYYALLMLVAFHTAAGGRIRTDTFVNALLLGIVSGVILQFFVTDAGFEAINRTPFRGHIAYLAVMGFGVSYVRISLCRSAGLRRSPYDALLAVAFLCVAVMGFSRAAWMACLLIFALVSRWTGRRAF